MRFSHAAFLSLLVAWTVAAGPASAARGDCSQPVSNGEAPAASDCLRVLQVAVGSQSCTPACMCAPKSGTAATASDALICLKKAVGQSVALACSCSLLRVHYPTKDAGTISFRVGPSSGPLGPPAPCFESSDDLAICNAGVVASGTVAKPVFASFDARGTAWKLPAKGAVDAWPHFQADDGTVERIQDFASAKLGNSRDVAVYFPPSYDENTLKSYPVLLLQDGQSAFDTADSFAEWQADEAMDSLANTGGIREAILVAPYATAQRLDEYTPSVDANLGGGKADLYLDFLLDELLPAIEDAYRIDDTQKLWIGGTSLGGLTALYGAWARPDDFAGAVALSPSLFWDEEYVWTLVHTSPPGKRGLTLSYDVGTNEDGSDEYANHLNDELVTRGFLQGVDYRYAVVAGGSHNEASWAQRLPAALGFLLRDPDRVQ